MQSDDKRIIRILYISGSVGLGHITRDLAIAVQLRQQCPRAEIAWIAAPPAGDVPASAMARLSAALGAGRSVARQGWATNQASASRGDRPP